MSANDKRWVVAIDAGSTGRDPTVICFRRGHVFAEFLRLAEPDLMATAGAIDVALRDRGFRPTQTQLYDWDLPADLQGGHAGWHDGSEASLLRAVVVDVVGVGDGLARRLQHVGWNVHRFMSSHAARDSERFINLRAEMHWKLREGFERGKFDLTACATLVEEITAVQWATNPKNRIQIERKDDLKKRLGRSPDHLDAAAMSLVVENASTGLGTIDVAL